MDEEIDFLLLGPFAEIVEKAQAALDAAQDVDNAEMVKAAQALLKEGERARKAIEPIAKRHLSLYGENFVTALKDHDGIAEHIDALNNLVYVFDDYTEPDSFDADKFKELGKTAQQTTLRITPILRRMKLEAPASATPPQTTPQIPQSSPFFTNTGISRVNSLGGRSSTSYSSSAAGARSPHPDEVLDYGLGTSVPSVQRYDTVVHAPGDAGSFAQQQAQQQQRDEAPVMGIQSGPDLGWNNGQSQNQNTSTASPMSRHSIATPTMLPSIPEPPPPPPPAAPAPAMPESNPWNVGERTIGTIEEEQLRTKLDENGQDDIVIPERRRRISTRPDSPTLPSPTTATPPANALSSEFVIPPPPPPTSSFPLRLDEGVDAWQQNVARGSGSADPSPRTMPMRSDQLAAPPGTASFSSSSYGSSSGHNYVFSQQQQQQQQGRQSVPGPTSAPAGFVSPRQSQISNTTASTASSTNGSVFSFDSYLNGLSNQMRDSSLDPISPVAGPAALPVAVSPNSPTGGAQPQLAASFASVPSPQQQHQQPQPQQSQPQQQQQPPPLPQPQQIQPMLRPPIPVAVPQMHPDEQPGLEIIRPQVPIDPGLIPVDSPDQQEAAAAKDERLTRIRPADCNIGPGSSYHLLKGFCEGAKEVQRGNAGVRQIKKLSYSGAGAYAAKCTHCLYELQWSEVDKDRQNLPSANYRMHGIGFRLRFLSKCHLPAKQVDDPLYACIFCLQEGHTLEESDATVFFTQGQLFSHLSRHPRPLPEVQGVTVIDGPERPEPYRNDYDLHFTLPPGTSELDGIRRELQQLPTAVAIETFRKAHGALRKPFDGAMPIQFPVGSKIVGIEFPAKYKGDWAVGWFDNVRGPFPVEHVRLDPPPRNEIRTQGTSALRATARWKWGAASAYRNSEWLKLDRNETVTNIIWSHPEHWCWAGTNSKGKWGYFPQSHIEPNSLKEGAAGSGSDAASVVSQERAGGSGGGGGFLSRLRSHNNHSNNSAQSIKRPVSIASHSTSSSR